MKSTFRRWLAAIAMTPTRKAALGVAGVALAGAALTGATHSSAADAAPTAKTSAVVVAAAPVKGVAGTAKPAPPAPVAPAKAAAPAKPAAAAPAAPPTPKEEALGYDFKLQPNYFYCGPAATRIALSAVGQANSFDGLAQQLGTTENGTNSAIDIARVLNAHVGAGVYKAVSIPGQTAKPNEIDRMRVDIVHAVTHGHAVVGNVKGTAVDLLGGAHSYEGGHYLTIVGYGEGGTTVKIADPADTAGDGSYWMSTVNAANWIASRGYAA